jgi:RimJ/RimL family protein N-acetyltransferase
LVGELNARSPRDAFPDGVYEFGIAVYGDDDRGRGYATEAVRLLVRHLFEERGAARVQCSTDVENGSMQTVAERAGLRREGVLRGYMPAGGARRDYTLYAITRSDWTENGARWT